MRSPSKDIMPSSVKRTLAKFGRDIAIARKKRCLTVLTMAERLGVAKSTYIKVEKGDPSVAMGTYAMALFVLGLGDALGDMIDASRDDQGLLLDVERLPKRVRTPKSPKPL